MLSSVIECAVLGEDTLNCSDHYPVTMKIDVGHLLPTTVNAESIKMPKWNKVSPDDLTFLYTDVVEKKLQKILTSFDGIESQQDIDNAIDQIVSILWSAGKAMPVAAYRPNLKPFWNLELKELKVQKVAKFRSWVMEGRPRFESSVSWQEHKKAKKDFANAIKRVSKA